MQKSLGQTLCEIHKQPLTFYCKNPKCPQQFYAFGCPNCIFEQGIHRHSNHSKHRQTVEAFLNQIDQRYHQDQRTVQFIEKIKSKLARFQKQNLFYKKSYSLLLEKLRKKNINRFPLDVESQETLIRLKYRDFSKIKQKAILKLFSSKSIKIQNNTLTEDQYMKLKLTKFQQIVDRIGRKFRINFETNNKNIVQILKVDKQLLQIDTIESILFKQIEQQEIKRNGFYEGGISYIVKNLEKIKYPAETQSLELEIFFDQGLEIKLSSYKELLGILLNEFYNLKAIKFIITDAFFQKQKLEFFAYFLMEMNKNGNLKKFILLYKEIVNSNLMKTVQKQIKILDNQIRWDEFLIDYYYN